MSVTVAHGAAHAPGDSGGDGSAPSGGSLRAHAACLRPGRRLPPPFLPPMFSQLFSSCRLSLGCFFGSPSACLARGAQQDRSCLSCGAPWAARPLSRPPASSQCRGVWTAPVISCLWFLVPRRRPSRRFQWASGLFLRTRRCKPYVPHWGLLASHRFGWDHSKSGCQEAGHISAFDGTSYLCKKGQVNARPWAQR